MGLKAKLASLDGLDDAQKALYRQDGDVFLLDVEPVDGWELTGSGLKNALQSERAAREEAEGKLKAFTDLDPDKAREALEKVERMKDWTPEEKLQEQIQAKTQVMAQEHEQELEKLRQTSELYRRAAENSVEAQLAEALDKHKFIAPKLNAKLFRDSVRMVEKDGQLVTEVVGPDGKALTRVDSKTGNVVKVSIDEFIGQQAAKEDYAELIKGNTASGTRGSTQTQQQTHTQPDNTPRPNYTEGQGLEKLSQALTKG